MKKYIAILACSLISLGAFSQKSQNNKNKVLHLAADTVVVDSNKLGGYISLGVSVGNGDNFKTSSYPSVEVGLSKGAMSYGFIVGKSSFEKSADTYWEAKTAASTPVGSLKGYLLFGVGNYFGTDKVFIEYGTGLTFSTKAADFFLQVSNWDKSDYVSFGISKTIF